MNNKWKHSDCFTEQEVKLGFQNSIYIFTGFVRRVSACQQAWVNI